MGFMPEGVLSNSSLDDFYKVDPNNWFKALPYCFLYTSGEGIPYYFYLPISPSNITITTPFATNIITTLYSVVEEHSEQRYYDITIEGTTGMAPQYYTMMNTAIPGMNDRTSFDVYQPLFGGLFAKTESIVNKTVGIAKDLMNTASGSDGNVSGLAPDKSGYAAFHNLYRFLLNYKKQAASTAVSALGAAAAAVGVSISTNKPHPLSFLNYKDGVAYNCSIQRFTLRRSAESPMLYNYSIQMRCFNMRSIDGIVLGAQTDVLANLGLGGLGSGSLMNKMKNIAGSAKGIVGGLSAGFSILGS